MLLKLSSCFFHVLVGILKPLPVELGGGGSLYREREPPPNHRAEPAVETSTNIIVDYIIVIESGWRFLGGPPLVGAGGASTQTSTQNYFYL